MRLIENFSLDIVNWHLMRFYHTRIHKTSGLPGPFWIGREDVLRFSMELIVIQ